MQTKHFFLLVFSTIFFMACAGNEIKTEDTSGSEMDSLAPISSILPQATLYEVNLRQFTPEGTLAAFEAHIPRLKELGIDIVWFMPIFPIGELKRKGGMGSAYSVKDYLSVNPDYGTIDEFKQVVTKLHEAGIYAILDWVPNHTGWDHVWMKDHKDWYTHDPEADTITHTVNTDWYDVADLNYDNPDMRQAMIEALLYWVRETDIDGFRMDVASFVPDDFWQTATDSLKAQKDLFLLAESDKPSHRNKGFFHATYAWKLLHSMNMVAKGEKTTDFIWEFIQMDRDSFNQGWSICFTTNHDENSWNGTVFERYGEYHKAYAVLAMTIEGMPLIYSGQEAGLDKALRFFEKDTIQWGDYSLQAFYSTLLKLKHDHPALKNGIHDSPAKRINSSELVMAYSRTLGDDTVVVAINLGKDPGTWEGQDLIQNLKPVFDKSEIGGNVTGAGIDPGAFQVWVK